VIEFSGMVGLYRPHIQTIIDHLNTTFGPGAARLATDSDYRDGKMPEGTIGIVMPNRIIDGTERVRLPPALEVPRAGKAPSP
jgi:hypothetical protein